MQISHILSDLTSFRLCGHEEALNLVTANASARSMTAKPTPTLNREYSVDRETDPDLKRAFDLMELHRSVKLKLGQQSVGDEGLERARRDVEDVLIGLGKRR